MWPELLARTNYAMLQGASHPEEMVEAAVALGLTHLGVVDRDGVHGIPRAHKLAREAGLPLVCGSTLTVAGHGPVSMLVIDARGWANLCRSLTEARANAEKGRAVLGVDRLAARAEGLFCVLRGGWDAAAAGPLREAFGERLLAVATRRRVPGDRERERRARDLASALSIRVIASNDALYHAPARARVADVLTCIRRGTTLERAGAALAPNAERHLLGPAALGERFSDWPEALVAARDVAESCGFSLDELCYQYPREVVPDGWTPIGWLRERVRLGLTRRYPEGVPAQVAAQVVHELRVIEQLDFPSYFLTVDDIVQFARGQGILCQGRGSAANSAVCFALGITSVDPARQSTLFERFISAERGEPPDIDVDFEHERREEVIQYVYARYGRDRAALVDEVISYRGRSAIRDVGKVFGLSLDQVDRLAKGTDRWSAGAGVQIDDLVREVGLDPTERAVRQTLAIAGELRGFPRHLSIHVGGFTITEGKLLDLVPIEPAAMDARTVIQWDKDDIDIVKFVKVDLLGLGMLTAIRRSFDLIAQHHGVRYDLASVPAEDPAVYAMFQEADTVGVFQIESRAQMSMLPRLRPACFYDLVIEVAIVRPGPIQGGMVHPYLRRRRGEEPVTYAHPDLVPILERTLGVPLFQEQVMQMSVAVGGFTPGEADNLRRAMGAWRKRGGLDAISQRLVDGMISRGIAPEFTEAIRAQILGFGEYGFPESHAASFALLVYVSGWLKRHYPAAFAAGLINSQPMGFYSPRSLVADAQRHGVPVRPISVARSDWDCTLEPTPTGVALRLGLRLVVGLAEDDGRRLVASRASGPFASLAALAVRTRLGRGALRRLADADAFADLGVPRRSAAWVLQGLWTGLPLFEAKYHDEVAADEVAGVPPLPEERPMDALRADYRSTGLSVDRHPVGLMRPALDRRGIRRAIDVLSLDEGSVIDVVGLVTVRQRPGTANGVVFMTLEDETGMINLVLWARVWADNRKVGRSAVIVGARGRLQKDGGAAGTGGAASLVVERLFLVDAATEVASASRDFH